MLDEINNMIVQHDTRDLNEVDLYIQSIFKWFHEQGATEVKPEQVLEEMTKDNLSLVPDSFDINDLSDSILQLTLNDVSVQTYVNGSQLTSERVTYALNASVDYVVTNDGHKSIYEVHLNDDIASIRDRQILKMQEAE